VAQVDSQEFIKGIKSQGISESQAPRMNSPEMRVRSLKEKEKGKTSLKIGTRD
jgi:hypothetical protein